MRTRDVIWYLWLSFDSDPASDDSGIVTSPRTPRLRLRHSASQSVKTLRRGQSRDNWVIWVYYLFTQQSSENIAIPPAARFQHLENNRHRQSSVCDKWIFPGILMMSNILRFLSANVWREDLKWSSGEMLHGHEWVSKREGLSNFHVLHFVMLHDPQNNLAINLIWRRSTRNLAAVAVNFSVKLNPGYFRVLILNVRHRKFNPAVRSNRPDSYRLLLVKSSLAKLL